MRKGYFDVKGHVDRSFRKGVLNIIILNSIKKDNMHPYALLQKLKKARNPMVRYVKKSDVYNAINAMEKKGFVKGVAKLHGSVVQKKYRLTRYGERVVGESKKILAGHIAEMKKLIKAEFNE